MKEPRSSLSCPPATNGLLLEVNEVAFLDNGPYSLSVQEGECVGLFGQSGVGKTQLLRVVADLLPFSGEIRLNGKSSVEYQSPEWRRMVGMVPADPCWWFDLVGEHFSSDMRHVDLMAHLAHLGFDSDVLSWQVSRLSTGERQRLAFLRAVVLVPVVLLLDEPTSALDAHFTSRLEDLVAELRLNRKTTIIWVSHDKNQLERVADKTMRVEKRALLPAPTICRNQKLP